MAVILQDAPRDLFYAPFYGALARDAFAAEGTAHAWYAAARRASAPGAGIDRTRADKLPQTGLN
jgi:hypothetical protein